ncbi:MAG: hypothetical protein RL341_1258, partial [Pseudomonadota bacterium]
ELPIARLLPLLRRAHSMISVDTGPAHAAAALGCPLVVMFGLMGSTRWLPRSSGSPVIALESGKGEHAAVADFTPDQVITAWRQLLKQQNSATPLRSIHAPFGAKMLEKAHE